MILQLNEEQKAIVQAADGPILVLAGAGTGKTFVIIEKVKNLVEKGLNSITCVSFSNKAAMEIKYRLAANGIQVNTGTFHSLCLNFLLRNKLLPEGSSLIDESDQKKICDKLAILEHWLSIQRYKEGLNILEKPGFIMAYQRYQDYLKENNFLDFVDLILITLEKLKDNSLLTLFQVDYLIIDEFQDANKHQYELMKLWTKNDYILLVGDPDQLIYCWRGADEKNIRRYLKEYNPQIFKLEQNYRSTQEIIDVANSIIAAAPNRIAKKLWSNKTGKKVSLIYADNEPLFIGRKILEIFSDSQKEENSYNNSVAILVRSSSLIKPIEQELIALKIKYQITSGTRFFDKLEVKVLLAYLKLIFNSDLLALELVTSYPRRGIGPKKLDYLQKIVFEEGSLDRALIFVGAFDLAENLKKWKRDGENYSPYDFINIFLKESGLEEFFSKDNATSNEYYDLIRKKMKELNNIQDFLLGFFTLEANQTHENVIISTIHAAKGLEFDCVFVPGLVEGNLPCRPTLKSQEIEEERRLLYVAITRAKTELFLSYSLDNKFATLCRFLLHIPANAIKRDFA